MDESKQLQFEDDGQLIYGSEFEVSVGKIVLSVTKRIGDFHVCIKNDNASKGSPWAAGKNTYEAVGDLVLHHPEHFATVPETVVRLAEAEQDLRELKGDREWMSDPQHECFKAREKLAEAETELNLEKEKCRQLQERGGRLIDERDRLQESQAELIYLLHSSRGDNQYWIKVNAAIANAEGKP